MKKIIYYIINYIQAVDKRTAVVSVLFIAIAVFINYYHGLNRLVGTFSTAKQLLCWYGIFLTAFLFPYIANALFTGNSPFRYRNFVLLAALAPLLFAWKMAAQVHLTFTINNLHNQYWNQVVYWPLKLLVFVICLYTIWKLFNSDQPFYGTSTTHFQARPYFMMLLCMLPLIAAAATQPDFLLMYPKLKNVTNAIPGPQVYYRLLYELSYGTDFISIELFFRGFLVLAFAKWVGKDAILPMALFYCTIHFGKPLGECISSFFGGMLLGMVTYHTKTIWGGLMVHLGIAWLMELAGYMGNHFLK